MLVKDIIKLACDFTENQEVAKIIEEGSELSEEQSLICESLLKCFNLVNNEVASEYFPLVKSEVVQTKDFKVNFADLSIKPYRIISVRTIKGDKVKFKVFEDYLFAYGNKVNVVYTYLPKEVTMEEEFNSMLPERVYAYGVAREYYFMQTLFDEADIWEERFKNTLEVLKQKKSETILPRRRWI